MSGQGFRDPPKREVWPMLGAMIVGVVFLGAAPPSAGPATEGAALAEYNARRQKLPETADAHYQLGLWCERNGLGPEAMTHFGAALRLDPRREMVWKHLGFKKHRGMWVREEELKARRAEAEAQKKANLHWEPLLRTWRSWLATKEKRDEAETALAGLTDPRAVPSISKVFGRGREVDQLRAVQVLGQIEGASSSCTLALLAVFGRSDHVREAAIATLSRRDSREFAGVLIGMLGKPLKYEVRPVGGPGSPGVLYVEGEKFNVRQVYASPSLYETRAMAYGVPSDSPLQFGTGRPGYTADPNYTLVGYDANGVPNYMPNAKAQEIWPQLKGKHPRPAGSPRAGAFVDGADDVILADWLQQQAIAEWTITETQKMAVGAQMQLTDDVSRIEAANAAIRERNQRALLALKETTKQSLGDDRDAWVSWWRERRGYAAKPAKAPDSKNKPTVTVGVPLPYVPQTGPPSIIGLPSRFCVIHNLAENPKTGKLAGILFDDSCFAAGTPVLTPEGTRPIESLREGDLIWSLDPATGRVETRPVLCIRRTPSALILALTAGGHTVRTTESHPFYRSGHGWTRAGDLPIGDRVESRTGTVEVETLIHDGTGPVYNLQVGGGSTYLVGDRGLLVHDGSPIGPSRPEIPAVR